MKNLNRKLSFGVALVMTSAILSCVPSVSASASSVYGDVDREGNSMITTRAYTSGGDSGGPMYIEYTLKGQIFRSVVGICKYTGGDGVRYRGGVRITTPILRFYMDNDYIG